MSATVMPGRLIALQQLYSTGLWGRVVGKMTYNKDGFIESRWLSFIPEPGKSYFLDPAFGVREIPASYQVTAYTAASRVSSDFKTPLKPNWYPRNQCQHFTGETEENFTWIYGKTLVYGRTFPEARTFWLSVNLC